METLREGARGVFITFEGIDGAGKSTHARLLADYLEGRGIKVLLTAEPGGGIPQLRDYLANSPKLTPEALYLLFSADRAEHTRRVILPALREGYWVISDRYLDSTLAYQAHAMGLRRVGVPGFLRGALEAINRLATVGLRPNLTFLLDLPPARAAGRHAGLGRGGVPSQALLALVRRAYLDMATAEPGRFRVLDATQPLQKVQEAIRRAIEPLQHTAGGPALAMTPEDGV